MTSGEQVKPRDVRSGPMFLCASRRSQSEVIRS